MILALVAAAALPRELHAAAKPGPGAIAIIGGGISRASLPVASGVVYFAGEHLSDAFHGYEWRRADGAAGGGKRVVAARGGKSGVGAGA